MPRNPVCERCHLAHPEVEVPENISIDRVAVLVLELQTCLAAQAAAMQRLLDYAGKKAQCDGPNCHAACFWVVHTNGKRVLYTPAGLNHFVDCPDSARFRKGVTK